MSDRKEPLSEVALGELLVIKEMVQRVEVKILKNDACDINVISSYFVGQNKHLIDIRAPKTCTSHSKMDLIETSTELNIDSTIRIGTHIYKSNFAVSDLSYDLLSWTPWHFEKSPIAKHQDCSSCVEGYVLAVKIGEPKASVLVTNRGARHFRSLLRKTFGSWF